MEIYERYASLFLHSNATFLCERAHAEVRTAASLEALASCYLRQGAAKRAYAVLCGCASSANGRYLLAVACYKLDKLAEAEAALLPDRAARAAGPKASRDLLLGPGSPVPHGAAGLHLLGVVCQHTHRRDHAVEYYRLALRLDLREDGADLKTCRQAGHGLKECKEAGFFGTGPVSELLCKRIMT